jgi:hypothetical protein
MEIDKYIGKKIIAWNAIYEDYGRDDFSENTRTFVYPRYLKSGDSYKSIDSSVFPNRGSIEVGLKDGLTAEEAMKLMGHLVTLRINKICYPNETRNNQYFMNYSKKHGKDKSEIWIEKFEGKEFYQILDINENIDNLLEKKYIPDPEEFFYTTEILLKNGDLLYGPFEYDLTDGKLNLLGMQGNDYFVGATKFYLLSKYVCNIKDEVEKDIISLLPKGLLETPNKCDIKYDWISKDKLIDVFISAIKNNGGNTKKQLRESKNNLKSLVENNSDVQLSKVRVDKINALLSSFDDNYVYLTNIIQYFLNDEELTGMLVKETVENNFELIENKLLESSKVIKHIEDLNNQRLGLEEDIKTLNGRKDEKKSIPDKLTNKELTELKKEYEESQNKLTKVLDENKELSSKLEDIGKSKDSIEDLKRNIKKLTEEAKVVGEQVEQQIITKNDMKKELNIIIQEYNDQAKTIAKTFDKDMLGRVLRVANGDKFEETTAKPVFDKSSLNNELSSSKIIERVQDYIVNSALREVSLNDVVNYLICISQGFITTFAGNPGTGKTSLCNILAMSLGLVGNIPAQRRYVDVSVERGWSSPKDFIGYYNSLTKTMEKSNAEVFDALSLLNSEYEEEEIAPYLILLDEANLSPIEHYWAPFLKSCDFDSSSNRSLSLGGNETWKIPKHLRFLATVNFDHTTEELSPRFLDRSWIITLNPSSINEDSGELDNFDNIDNMDDIVSFASLSAAFLPSKDDFIDDAISNKWNIIKAIYKKNSFQIMPRNLIMIHNYCLVACKNMSCVTPDTKLAPLDYAFSEKILPLVNGTGDDYKNLIDELLKECKEQNMPISNAHLIRIKNSADNNMGYYQFFSK